MKLSKKERIDLSLRFRILEGLFPDEAESYRTLRVALERGYALHYKELNNFASEELSEEDCTEVLDILGMYRAINDSYEDIKEKTDIEEHRIKFPGFDGNYEPLRMGYVHYFIEELGRFKEIEERCKGDYNSHMSLLDKYRRMLKFYNNAIKGGMRYKLSEQELKELLEA